MVLLPHPSLNISRCPPLRLNIVQLGRAVSVSYSPAVRRTSSLIPWFKLRGYLPLRRRDSDIDAVLSMRSKHAIQATRRVDVGSRNEEVDRSLEREEKAWHRHLCFRSNVTLVNKWVCSGKLRRYHFRLCLVCGQVSNPFP